jgi:GNAT superfamily N-acetyltransferase
VAKSSTESTVRYARPPDAPAIAAAYDWLFAPPGVAPQDWSPATAVGRLEAAMADDRAAVLVADDEGTIIGFATVYLEFVSVRFGQRAWIEDLAVAPERRSHGIGKALLDSAKSWARDQKADVLELNSGPARVDAHRFYEREHPDGWSRCFRWRL